MSLTCQVQLTLNNITKKKAETVKKALEPDNINFPKGLSLQMERVDEKLVCNFDCNENMQKLIGTIDEVMEHIQVTLRVIE